MPDARLFFHRSSALLLALALIGAALASTPARAQSGGDLSAFPLLRLDASARAAALGGAFAATYDGDASALFYHPALANEQSHNAVSASYLNHLSDLNAGFLAYSRSFDGIGTASGGLRFLSYGEFDGRDAQGNPTGDFGASQVALTLGLARALSDRIRYGANVHLVYGAIEEAGATALGADLGVLYHLPAQQLTVSASVNNLGAALDKYYQRDVDLPVDLRLAVSKRLRYLPLRLSVSGYNLHDFSQGPGGGNSFDEVMRHLAIGGELQPVDALALRLGYSHRRHQELRSGDDRFDPAGLSAGFGLTVRSITVDYAFSSWSEAGGLHQFGLRTVL